MTETALMTIEDMMCCEMDVYLNGGVAKAVDWIREEALSVTPDVTTAVGMKEAKSIAYSVARAKVAIDKKGIELGADLKDQLDKLLAVRRFNKEECQKIQDEVLKPVKEQEAKEQALLDAEVARREAERLEQKKIDDEELAYELDELFMLRKQKEEADRQEAKRKAEEAKQAEKERIRQEAIAQAKKDAEEALIKAEQEKAEAEARERRVRGQSRLAYFRMSHDYAWEELADMDQACFDRIASVDLERYEAKLAKEAKEKADRKAQAEADRKERERVVAEAKAKEEADRKAANKRHRNHVDGQAAESLIEAMQWDCEGDLERAMEVVRAISEGRVKHVTINY